MCINYYLSWKLKYYQKLMRMQNTCFSFLHSVGGLVQLRHCAYRLSLFLQFLPPHYEGHGQTSAGATAH